MKIRTGIEKLGKGMILLIFSIFTIFPFVWMILSALKTKAEIPRLLIRKHEIVQ